MLIEHLSIKKNLDMYNMPLRPSHTKFLKNAFKHCTFLNRFHFPLDVPDCYPPTTQKKRRENTKNCNSHYFSPTHRTHFSGRINEYKNTTSTRHYLPKKDRYQTGTRILTHTHYLKTTQKTSTFLHQLRRRASVPSTAE